MSNSKKFFMAIGLCGLTILLFAFFLTWLGLIDFRIVTQIQFDPFIEYCANVLMFMVNMFFVFTFSLNIFDKKILSIIALYLPIHISLTFLITNDNGIILSLVAPFIFIGIVAFCKRTEPIHKVLIRLGMINLIIPIYQQISGYIKLNGIGVEYYNCNIATMFIYSLDMYLFYILLYCVVKRYALESRKLFLHTQIDSVPEARSIGEESLDLSELNRRQRFLFWALAVGYQIFQLIVVLLIGLINNMLIELVVMLIVFWFGRAALKKSWHSDKLWVCSMVTFAGFYALTKLTLPLSASLFSCIALSALFVYVLHKAAIIEERYTYLKAFHDQHTTFSLKTCTEEQLRARCRQRGINPHGEQFALDAFITRMSTKELMSKYRYGESNTKTKKQRLIKKLED